MAKLAMEAPWYLYLGICQLRGNSFQQIIEGHGRNRGRRNDTQQIHKRVKFRGREEPGAPAKNGFIFSEERGKFV